MPRVSVIIPVHNRADLLGETLESVLGQTYRDWECIVVDDHSDDNVLDVAQHYAKMDPRIRAVSLPLGKRYGNAARNYGLALAEGEYISFLDSDDLITSNKFETQTEMLDSNPSLDMVTCRSALFREHPSRNVQQIKFATQESWLDAIWAPHPGVSSGSLWQTGCPMWRTTAVKSIGGWNESIRMFEDNELDLRALLCGLRIATIDEIFMFVRTEPRQLTARGVENCPLIRDALIIAWQHLEDAQAVTELRRKLISLRFYRLARRFMNENLVLKGMSVWLEGSSAIGQGWYRTLCGIVLLATGHYRLLNVIHRWLRPDFVSHVNELPAPLPDIDRIPSERLFREAERQTSWLDYQESCQETRL